MNRNLLIVLVIGLIACTALYFLIDIYAGMIGAVIVIALAMSVFIMQDSMEKPNVVVFVEENRKGVRVRNRGNARAVSVKITLLPQDLSFDIPALDEDAVRTFPVPPITEKMKVDVRYRNEKGDSFGKTVLLMPDDIENEDLLKPVFPLFGWK